MKRKSFITILTTLLLLVLVVSAFTSCNKKDNDKDKDTTHTHTYSTEWSNDETNHWHAATCEHTSEKKDIAVHTYSEWMETKAPTYTEKGEKQRTCTTCSYVDKQEIDVLEAKENGITFNISARIYNKMEQGLTAEEYSVKGGTVASVEYKVKGAADTEYSSTAPVNAGEYTVKIKVTGNAEYRDVEATADFSIAKRELFYGQVFKAADRDYTKGHTTRAGDTYFNGSFKNSNMIDGDEIYLTITFAANEEGAELVSCVMSGKDAENYFLSDTVKPYLN